jgi:hypothetical protein
MAARRPATENVTELNQDGVRGLSPSTSPLTVDASNYFEGNFSMPARRILAAALTTTGVTAALLTASAAPANAATADCRVGEFCLFENSNGSGWILRLGGGYPTVERRLANHGMNDQASAFWNRTGAWFCVFIDTGLDGRWVKLPPAPYPSQSFDIAGFPWADNEISSVSIVGAQTSCDALD